MNIHLFYIVTVCFSGEKRSKSKSGVKNKAHTIIPPTPSVFRLTYKLLKKKTYWNICLPLFWLQKPFQNNIFAHSVNREYYMALSVSHPVSTRDTNIIPRALARVIALVEGWHGMWYGKSHIILWLTYTLAWESRVLYYEPLVTWSISF